VKLDEILTKYGGEVIQRPAIDTDTEFEYKGYKAMFSLNDGVYVITYDPPLLPKIERMYRRCKRQGQCKDVAIKAIDLAHAAEVQASGQVAQAGSAALDQHGGPLERANG
jgi:hypothetical protein